MPEAKTGKSLSIGIAALCLALSMVLAGKATAEDSPIKVGGALGLNWIYGDYTDDRGDNIGSMRLEVFRIDADLNYNNLTGRVEYRYYNEPSYDYSMMHTAWLGYSSDGLGTVRAGIVRAPFGPGNYGISSSWFFDQHYYVGLIDDMDLGVRWTKSIGDLTVDVAYFLEDEGHWDGSSVDSARYSYDPVLWTERVATDGTIGWGEALEHGFTEDGQINLRAEYAIDGFGDIGASVQYGRLKGQNVGSSSADHVAASVHGATTFGNIKVASQLSYYEYDITNTPPWGSVDLIPMGAFNFAWPVASEAWIPSISLQYQGIDTSGFDQLHSVTPYLEWSSIVKQHDEFNDSSLLTLGAVWNWAGWYIYTDLAFSDGNYFVGNDGDAYGNVFNGVGDFGANGNDKWNARFNVNIRHYFNLYK
ncbi:MAG: hypothetical protein OXI73_17035 [Rhodospirillales bacterium]|nr:hypothetical protein [Rhodospirillales bacterium]MCY4002826.1 hypothetical protein [Rhodospirillales bacterium]MDE0374231.1 hypothetical protein [Rhodospirillales bacterium]MYE19275.1 hypothetical protein [Rhodospirillales bacterium]